MSLSRMQNARKSTANKLALKFYRKKHKKTVYVRLSLNPCVVMCLSGWKRNHCWAKRI